MVKNAFMSSSKKNQAGFTLIEMIVSLAIFSISVTITIGALLVLIASNQKLQGEQSVMTNLAFAMDSMTREIRTGTNYYCDEATDYNQGGPNNIFKSGNNQDLIIGLDTNSCEGGVDGVNIDLQGISIIEAGNSITGVDDRILYFFDQTDPDNKTLKRKVGAEAAQSIVSSGLVIENAEFFVSGAPPKSVGNNLYQPTVTIHITAREIDNDKKYYLQTTVTQRILDL